MLSSLHLKIIIIITMTIDHLGVFIFQEYDIFRIIGRICFPLIAFITTEGYLKTKNKSKYIGIILIFGLLMQVPNLFLPFKYPVNIFITIGISLTLIHLYETTTKWLLLIYIPFFGILLEFINADYGAYGMLLILFIYLVNKNQMSYFTKGILIGIIIMLLTFIMSGYSLQKYAVFAMFFIMMYSGKRGFKSNWIKYFFYIYYPLHILILALIGVLL